MPGFAPDAALGLLDDPQEWPAFGRPCTVEGGGAKGAQEGAWESQVVLEGMHCAACALTIERALAGVPGVLRADVNAATRRARVVWRPGAVLPSRWMAAVAQAGYRALPAADAFMRERRRQEARRALWRWLVAGLCMMQVMMYAVPAYVAAPGDMAPDMVQLLRWASWVLTLPVVFFCCGPFFASAWRGLWQRRVSMDLPVALGMAITFVVSTAGTFDPMGPLGHEVYFDSLTMFVFFLLTGRWLELRLRDRTAGALDALMNRLPQSVERRRADGGFERVAVRRLAVGDVVRVLPGEAFPADGTVVQGSTLADEALLTGESAPVARAEGGMVTAGSHNLQSAVQVRVERVGDATRFAQIVALMESASLDKPRLARLADRIATPFLLAVIVAGVLAGAWWWPQDHGRALMVAVAVFVVTCPCALSLATPVAMLAAAGTLARSGVLVRDLQALEALAGIDTVVFDKTGTLTHDGLALRAVHAVRGGCSGADAHALAAAVARHSLHPVARALAAGVPADALARWQVGAVREEAGQGLCAEVRGTQAAQGPLAVRLGSPRYCGVGGADGMAHAQPQEGPRACLADADGPIAFFDIGESVRGDAHAAVAALAREAVAVELLSGDRPEAARRVAAQAGIAHARGGCTPQDKLAFVHAAQARGRRVAMVGDGMNDGPVIAGADVSFAFGNAVPLAQARADFVVLGAQLRRIPQAVALARRTLRVVRQNLLWAALYNAVCVPLAVAGWLPAWLAGLGMAASSLLVVLNAARLARPLPETP
ncbi:cation-translocating P-type ATPase [Ramlibacter sp. H39-3-26]|uniref:heavy metal translocating P-type ATPase n=1 Tax=Curvibacter soli TaxID=3031331 RepID=UPI0023DA8080|nr:cation-translocating P-type ATPase [Ramlibacter sp. H39-3-26]MDF1485348.1 cation-translocating P-type ATPase [Ramlibacter sp. H39-3-26]